jgi:hypothetical protein
MQKITSSMELRAAIVSLEIAQEQEAIALKEEFYVAYQAVQPINILKNTVKEALQSQDLKNDLINASVGAVFGYVSKKLFEGENHSPTRKLVGKAIMVGVMDAVVKNPEIIKVAGMGLINLFRSSPKGESNENSVNSEGFVRK